MGLTAAKREMPRDEREKERLEDQNTEIDIAEFNRMAVRKKTIRAMLNKQALGTVKEEAAGKKSTTSAAAAAPTEKKKVTIVEAKAPTTVAQ